MASNRFGQECERCRKKFHKGEEVFLALEGNYVEHNHRFPIFLLCSQCGHDHVEEYHFLCYMVYVGGVGR